MMIEYQKTKRYCVAILMLFQIQYYHVMKLQYVLRRPFVFLYPLLLSCSLFGCQEKTSVSESYSQYATAQNGMVAAAHPLAAEAGAEILKKGGNAIDAAVASAFVVGVVEPMMSGIGGGGSMTIWMEDAGQAEHLNFYARAGADPDLSREGLQDDEIDFARWTAVPGAVAGLLKAHEARGVLTREEVLAPAIKAAGEGFLVHAMLGRIIAEYKERLNRDQDAAAIFYPGGVPLQAGDLLVQTKLAETLTRIAEQGRDGYYKGPVADEIVSKLNAGGNPISMADLAGYEAEWKRPLCGMYQDYTILTAPPPLGGVEILATLELLETQQLKTYGTPVGSGAALSAFVDAMRIAQADRRAFVGDPEYAAVPAIGMSSDAYAQERLAYMTGDAPNEMPWGDPWDEERLTQDERCQQLNPFGATTLPQPADNDSAENDGEEDDHTTHLSVIDSEGNAVSLTYTMGLYFGSGLIAGGGFLNSAANLFGYVDANQRGAHRTPRSTTAPTLVLKNQNIKLAVGAAGAGRIGPAVAGVITYILDYEMSPVDAIRMPRVYPVPDTLEVRIEDGIDGESIAELRGKNYTITVYPKTDIYFGGVHLVYVEDDGRLIGVADPRRNGDAAGY